MSAWVRMDPTELAINFRQAADPRKQINVLADLNACSPRRIAEQLLLVGALENTGILPEQFPSAYRYNEPVKKKKYAQTFDPHDAQRLYDEGLDDATIADRLGVAEWRIIQWRRDSSLRRTSCWRYYTSPSKKGGKKAMKKELKEDAPRAEEAPAALPAPVRQSEREEAGAMTVGTFIDSLRRLLSPALLNSPFAINGKIVNEIDGFNIDVRNNRIFIDLRTEADASCAGS